MSDKKATIQFISNVLEKNYKEANTALQKMVENKLKERIKRSLEQKNN
jgi:hypothetical protein